MARLRIRFRFNPGRTGAPMDKLGDFASQTERFLRSLALDLGLPARKGEWLASEFGNESFSFLGEYQGAVEADVAERGSEAVTLLTSDQPLAAIDGGFIEPVTAAEFGQIGKFLDADEHFFVGVHSNGGDPTWRQVTQKQTAELRALLATPIITRGSIQGVIHSWHTGATPPFFNIRDMASGELVHCIYNTQLHRKILQGHETQERAVVHVYGQIRWDRTKAHVVDMSVDDIELTTPLTDDDFHAVFGSMPHFTGDMSTTEYLDWIRGSGD